jgi:NADH-quinone oxidoreductase subunit E
METEPQRTDAQAPAEESDLAPDWADKLDAILDKFQGRPGSLIPVMQQAQGALGYLPREVQEYIADGLNVNSSEVFGVATFYAFFRLKPVGRHVCKVCLGTACYVMGGEKIFQQLEKDLGVGHCETTPDKRFTLEGVRCVGACGLAPVVIIDSDVHREVDVMQMRKILDEYK